MTSFSPIFRSPVANPNYETQNLKGVDLTGIPIILIQGEAGALLQEIFSAAPARPGDVVDTGTGLLARLTPKEFYLFGKTDETDLPSVAELDRRLAQSGHFAHATDYTHGQTVIKLSGPAAGPALSKICGLDFHDSGFPNRQVKQTSAAKIKALIVRADEGDTPTYYLHVSRPLGQYFWETLQDAAQEFMN